MVEGPINTQSDQLIQKLQVRPDQDLILKGAQLYLKEQEAKENQATGSGAMRLTPITPTSTFLGAEAPAEDQTTPTAVAEPQLSAAPEPTDLGSAAGRAKLEEDERAALLSGLDDGLAGEEAAADTGIRAEPEAEPVEESYMPALDQIPERPHTLTGNLVLGINNTLLVSIRENESFAVDPEQLGQFVRGIKLPNGAEFKGTPLAEISNGQLSLNTTIGTKAGDIKFFATLENDPSGGLRIVNKHLDISRRLRILGQAGTIEDNLANMNQLITETINKEIVQGWSVSGFRIEDQSIILDLAHQSSPEEAPDPIQVYNRAVDQLIERKEAKDREEAVEILSRRGQNNPSS